MLVGELMGLEIQEQSDFSAWNGTRFSELPVAVEPLSISTTICNQYLTHHVLGRLFPDMITTLKVPL